MSNYYLILLWIVIVTFVSMSMNVYKKEMICGKEVERMQWLWAFLIFLPLIVWCGWREGFIDTGAYIDAFVKMPETFTELPEYLSNVNKDKGFYLLSSLVKVFVSRDEHIYLLILAAIQGLCLLSVYRKYSTRYIISFFLFIASTDYLSWMFNGVRQFTAVTIIFAGLPLLLKKKYVSYIIIVLVASTIHGSALLMIPFAFIVQGRAWNAKTVLFLFTTLVAISFVGEFTNILDVLLTDTQYTNVVSDWQNMQDDGTSVFRVLVYSVPVVLAFIGKRFIWAQDDPVINLSVNMSIVSTGFYIISMFTSGIFIGRLPIYFSLYNYILLPWEIENMFTLKSRKIIYIMLVLAYLLFYYYQVHVIWQLA